MLLWKFSLGVFLLSGSLSAQVYYSKQNFVDNSTGYILSKVDGSYYRGSGVIARNPRLIYSCAHLAFENGSWASETEFHPGLDSFSDPNSSSGLTTRGYRYFTSYSSNARTYGGSSSQTFAYDFLIHYGYSDFGTAVGWWPDGAAALRSSRSKRIVGYPSKVDYTNVRGYYYQHATDWFTRAASQTRGSYYRFQSVSTGSGNSGGPVFVWDSNSDKSYLAAILVSGSSTTAGVYALNDATDTMASKALDLEEIKRNFVNKKSVKLRNNTKSYSTKKISVNKFYGNVVSISCAVDISTQRKGDLDVYLKSPSGRVKWINKSSSNKKNHIAIKRNFSSTFRGSTANGTWKLKMRDTRNGKTATFNRFGLTIKALEDD